MDELQARSVPMKVVGLGLCRTGTQSLCDALELLGFGTSYHMQEVMKNGHLDYWTSKIENMTEKDAPKSPPTPAELDHYMGAFQGVCDVPPALFPTELLDAYPDAKVVLTKRPVESWVKSMQTSLLPMFESSQRSGNHMMVPMGKALNLLWDDDFAANGTNFFLEHNRKAREETAKRGRPLLELDVSEPDAWQKLCAFLEVESPEGVTTFPNRDFFRQLQAKMAAAASTSTATTQAEKDQEMLRAGEEIIREKGLKPAANAATA